jgi:ABC-type phosphate transport system substrate-binding protein
VISVEEQLRELLEAVVGEPPRQVNVENVRRKVVRRRVIEGVAGAAAVVLMTAAGVAAYAKVSGPAPVSVPPALHKIVGSGSSGIAPAIGAWARHERRVLAVSYNPAGDEQGRIDYIQGRDDFAASGPPFQIGVDKLGGVGPEHVPWGYSYVPAAASGTAFLYHLSVHGHLIRNLRLSPQTVMEIFTGQITNWDSPQITRDYGHRLPNLPITLVIHSEGSGDTFFLTLWLATLYPHQWNAFCARAHPGITAPCGSTEFYPVFRRDHIEPENGSANVAAYIAASYGQGSIGYDDYAYALSSHVPAVELRNPAGRYVLPTPANVTAALTRAAIDTDPTSPNYLQQNLTHVYSNPAPASYPLSAYTYLIVPRSGAKLPPVFSKPAGRSLSTFLDYGLCQGQSKLTPLGYAPLPASLVKGGLLQVGHIPGHVAVPPPSRCRP